MEMVVDKKETSEELSFAKRLKFSTRTDHDGVDKMVMASKPFDNEANYAKFLTLQHVFHSTVSPLYQHADLQGLFPGLAELPRLSAVELDLKDLGMEPDVDPSSLEKVDDIYEAIGWLYCSEGSNIGAAFLYKETQKLNFDADRGARHLAAHADGRAPHWRKFVAQLDALCLTEEQEALAVKGAVNAFDFYKKALRTTGLSVN
ncbi:biliverdin-producing heme oxygenase [Marinomonas transparens]|uniref:Biliverdin-producing heme oxygenase n=1 Tax=Marinomonas transparens TaxID=2795388 RepID=A0A934JRL0_9GAMM|nr:biliverdin-producing heme oxygenase [Marinomonas transparens]MBJ7536135.1 biliverdin-producing heme oxygenase [Marinomonas transparens]